MLLSKNVTKYGYFRIISHDSVTKIVNKYLTEERNVQSKRNLVGYLVLQPNKCLNEKSDLKGINHGLIAHFSSNSDKGYSADTELTPVQFEKVSDETLDSLTEYFDELIEKAAHLTEADVSYGSGPKRYDFVNGKWIYKHDGKTLHELLNSEIPAIVMNATCFEKCSFSGKEKEAIMDTLQ
nr:frataxin, mitochondrial isoform X3 [Nomia melanderi]